MLIFFSVSHPEGLEGGRKGGREGGRVGKRGRDERERERDSWGSRKRRGFFFTKRSPTKSGNREQEEGVEGQVKANSLVG